MLLNAQTKMDAVLLYGADGANESYLLTEDISINFDGDEIYISIGDENIYAADLEAEGVVDLDFRTAFVINGTNDPAGGENYYSTFFSSEGAYKLPESGVTAYVGTPEGKQLKMTDVGNIIAQGEPVVLKATSESFVLMPTAYGNYPTEYNALDGTDYAMLLGNGDYALSFGQDGIGFYPWDGNAIADNNAYLPFGSLYSDSPLTLKFDDEDPTAIEATPIITTPDSDIIYNLSGMRVNKDYKGIVIKNGKKILQK